MRIDGHQHFWQYSPSEHIWMTEEMNILKRDYLPDDIIPLLKSIGFDGTITVQARQMLKETDWLLELSDQKEFMKGVVGWVDLCSSELRSQLEKYSKHLKFKGVRHVVHDEPDDKFMLRDDFQRGIAQLQEFGLTYDLLLYPRHLPIAIKLVEKFPDQPFVVDHISKPAIKEKLVSPWQEDLRALAMLDNVYCKLSGMVTEASWHQWAPDDFKKYSDIVLDAFGLDRVMIGSDWPVCTLSSDYRSAMNIVIDYVQEFPIGTREKILGENCARFYRVTV
ncbi:MAG: amidohydrolase family protein [Ignavibacteria bacterium]|nr:amidohydrolase family protein [Ignavibacteria bacterium]